MFFFDKQFVVFFLMAQHNFSQKYLAKKNKINFFSRRKTLHMLEKKPGSCAIWLNSGSNFKGLISNIFLQKFFFTVFVNFMTPEFKSNFCQTVSQVSQGRYVYDETSKHRPLCFFVKTEPERVSFLFSFRLILFPLAGWKEIESRWL